MEAERLCLQCSKPVRGRADKKFCNDYCRNSYNNRQNGEDYNLVRNFNNILRRNRRILQQIFNGHEGTCKYPKTKMLQEGYDLNFHTHQYTNKNAVTYHFCYEYGFLPLDGDWVLVVRRRDNEP